MEQKTNIFLHKYPDRDIYPDKYPDRYIKAWQTFDERKKVYEDSCRAKESDQIATELYNFVDTRKESPD